MLCKNLMSCGNALILSLLVTLQSPLTAAIAISSTSSPDDIKSAAKQIATEMMGYYTGDQPGQTPGYLPGDGQPGGYYWWVGGGMFGTMINYWMYTGDTTWVDATSQAIWFQSDPSSGGYFDSVNVSAQLGNDDQAFWAFAAMEAAEYKFPNPPASYPSWLAMTQGVFNQQVQRWDPANCNGGLRWQVFPVESGWNYKNSISNGCFFNIAARLGKYTGNSTYIDWAIKMYDWSTSAGLIAQDYTIVDGIVVGSCSDAGHIEQWSYNIGVYLYGAAAMWNITQTNKNYSSQASVWQTNVEGLLKKANTFFKQDTQGQNVLTEVICEPQGTCKVDQSTFKAYLARWMRATAFVAPFTAETVANMLAPSVAAAGQSCTGPAVNGGSGVACGQQWYTGGFDGKTGIGMQMNALEVIATLLPGMGPLTAAQGDSASDPSAGSETVGQLSGDYDSPVITVTTADRAGAAILTIIFGVSTLFAGWWVTK